MIRRFKRAAKRRPRLTVAQLWHRYKFGARPIPGRDRRRVRVHFGWEAR